MGLFIIYRSDSENRRGTQIGGCRSRFHRKVREERKAVAALTLRPSRPLRCNISLFLKIKSSIQPAQFKQPPRIPMSADRHDMYALAVGPDTSYGLCRNSHSF